MLARLKKATAISISFSETTATPSYLTEALSSEFQFTSEIIHDSNQQFDWPPNIDEMLSWPYSSFRRIALLSHISGIFPTLAWPLAMTKKIEALADTLRRETGKKVVAIHLKNQGAIPEESNANFTNWEAFFQQRADTLFLLLGHDVYPERLHALPNLRFAHQLGLNLSEQLAICSVCDGFMGMASGICTGAFFSQIPYVVFKHPLHHPEEMRVEIDTRDHLPFARQRQKLWRKIDSLENLHLAYKLLDI